MFRAAAILSLLLCVATTTLWIRSYWRTDLLQVIVPGEIEWPGDHGPLTGSYMAASSRGSIWIERWEEEMRLNVDDALPPTPSFDVSISHSPQPFSIERGWEHSLEEYAGFARGAEFYSGSGASSELRYVLLPHWCVALGFALIAFAILRVLRVRRTAGFCVNCGYDLRATPDRCPECGQCSSARRHVL